ncbi:ABC transporter ATP-binding protein [Halostella sp. JP-L12]|uniref:ABC transporter ATP-binding protein n=1 Tax=Halostella TaxID=1843185 RepID=UPI000EF780E2|nr:MULTISPECIES: ABC transporter ATP-binding protein [Halostella]NHN46627.1 ABC transporter ATP-binding protein [Halostella sp. JP-L12]
MSETNSNDIAIRTENLTKRYGDVTALDDVSLSVRAGEVFGFLGPNGAGKTTTIDLLLDFIRPTSGSATVLGYDANAEADAVRDRIGILPDGFDLWGRSTGYRHLEFAIESKGGEETPDELLDRVGLDPADAERKVGEYSKGMAQRLAMGMALAGDPDLLILDEPSTGLDPHGIREMQALVREEAAGGTTVFFSSHILGQVSAVCDRVGILNEGRLVAIDTIEGLRESAGVGTRLVVDVDGAPPVDIEGIEGVVETDRTDGRLRAVLADDAAKAQVIHRLVEAGATVRDFRSEEATLEDLFAAYTGTGPETPVTATAEGNGRVGASPTDSGTDADRVATGGGDRR